MEEYLKCPEPKDLIIHKKIKKIYGEDINYDAWLCGITILHSGIFGVIWNGENIIQVELDKIICE